MRRLDIERLERDDVDDGRDSDTNLADGRERSKRRQCEGVQGRGLRRAGAAQV